MFEAPRGRGPRHSIAAAGDPSPAKTATELRPRALAALRALSAAASTAAASGMRRRRPPARSSPRAAPKLAPYPNRYASTALRSFFPTSTARCSGHLPSRMASSSPPSARQCWPLAPAPPWPLPRRATGRSPARCPLVSLNCLKWSRPENIAQNGSAPARAVTCSSNARNAARLVRPVSELRLDVQIDPPGEREAVMSSAVQIVPFERSPGTTAQPRVRAQTSCPPH